MPCGSPAGHRESKDLYSLRHLRMMTGYLGRDLVPGLPERGQRRFQ